MGWYLLSIFEGKMFEWLGHLYGNNDKHMILPSSYNKNKSPLHIYCIISYEVAIIYDRRTHIYSSIENGKV